MTKLETGIALSHRLGATASMELAEFLRRYRVNVVPLDDEQTMVALSAFQLYGKGRHPAGLNFGDCAAYALARVTGEALLFKGSDFSQTDITSVL